MQGVRVDFEGFFFLDVSEMKIMSSYPLEKCLKCCNYGYKAERFHEWWT